MNVGILGEGIITWAGGIDLAKNYINSIYKREDLSFYLLIPTANDNLKDKIDTLYHGLRQDIKYIINKGKTLNTNPYRVHNYFLSDYPEMKVIHYMRDRSNLVDLCKKNKIDILFPCCNSLPEDFPISWIGYIFDCQHKYLPQMFSQEECEKRDRAFSAMLRNAKSIIVTSNAVKADCEKFYNCCNCRIHVVPYLPMCRENWLSNDESVLTKYNICYKYFIISNQLWKHKEHLTAIEALYSLHNDLGYSDIHLVCTGGLSDGRWANYYNEVMKRVHEFGLSDYVHFLGYIDKLDQIQLIKKSIALIQPTQFEGQPGGGSTADALSLGKKAILSDIDVNKEIVSENVIFFEMGNPTSLMKRMNELIVSEDNHSWSNIKILDRTKENRTALGNYIYSLLCEEVELQKKETIN